MIPAWKVKREWARFRMQVGQWPWFLFGALLRRRYDLDRQRRVVVHQGARPVSEDVAVLLCYQPDGILPSFLAEIEHFLEKGFAPVVVSNLPLSSADRESLLARCHLIIERPNYGYDFGGYREGILTLQERGVHPRNLVVKNDSVWFPLWPDCSLLDHARADPSDLFGVYLNERPRQPHKTHLQSYFYRFNGRMTRSSDFADFWQRMMMTNNKHTVIRQNEMKLTNWFRRRGYTVGHLIDGTMLRAAVMSLDDDALRRLMQYQVQVETRSERVLRPLITEPANAEWRSKIAQHLERQEFGKYFLISHPSVLLGKLRVPFLKKDRQPMYRLQRSEARDCGYLDTLRPIVREEIAGWDRGSQAEKP